MQPAPIGRRAGDRDHRHATATIAARVWKLAVGRNTLLLLDSDVEGNRPEDRELTARLYGGDDRMRIRQELLLGVGGVRALKALGISPAVAHLNEGHSAFAALELVRERMATKASAPTKRIRRVAPQIVFTTHTPVPAGHDRFTPELIEEHLGPLRDALGLSPDALMALGRVEPGQPRRDVLHDRAGAEAVAPGQRGVVAARPGRRARCGRASTRACAEDEVPIGHITNGVHVPTWLAPQMHQVYDRHLGPDWPERCGEPECWDDIEGIDDGELWETHQALKARLIDFVRRRTANAARAARRAGRERRAAASSALSLDGADDRLRPALRHLQAGGPDLRRHRAHRRAGERPADARSSSSSPARRIRATSRARRSSSRSRA